MRARFGECRRGPQLGRGLFQHRRSDADRATHPARALKTRHRRASRRDPGHRRRSTGPLFGDQAAPVAGRYHRCRGSRLPGCDQHGSHGARAGAAAPGGPGRAGPVRRDECLQMSLRHPDPPVSDHRHHAARTKTRAAGDHQEERPVRDRGRLRIRHRLRPDPAAGAEGPRRLGQRHLCRHPLEVAAAGAAHRIPGRGSGVHPGSPGAAPPPHPPPAGEQPEERGAVPATGIFRPLRGQAHEDLQAAMRRDARSSDAT